MTYDKMQEQITAYVLGELTGNDLAEFENLLGRDALLQYEVKEFKAVADLSTDVLTQVSSPAFRLSDDQLQAIEEFSESLEPPTNQAASLAGARKEDSVLFSLSNLQSLADHGTTTVPDSPGAPDNSEMSGLIDIRKLINVNTEGEQRGSDDSILTSISALDTSFGAPTLQVARAERNLIAWKIAAAAGFLLVLVASVIVAVMLTQDDTTAQDDKIAALMKQLEEIKKSGGSASDLEALQAKLNRAQNEKTAPASLNEPAGESADEEETALASAPEKSPKTTNAKKKRVSRAGAKSASAKSKPAGGSSSKEAPVSTSTTPKKHDALDDLLGGSPSKKPAKKRPSSAPTGAASRTKLSRSEVISGMNAVKSSVARCGAGQSGSVKIRATISPAGRVTSAMATGSFAGTPTGSCAARAVKRAKFPKAKQPTTVTYPFKL